MRVCDMLERDMCVLSEIIPLDNPYSEYMHMVEADRLARRCRELLDGNKWQETALQKADLFRQQMDVRAICTPVIEATVKAMGG
jgi:hypothetical protein